MPTTKQPPESKKYAGGFIRLPSDLYLKRTDVVKFVRDLAQAEEQEDTKNRLMRSAYELETMK